MRALPEILGHIFVESHLGAGPFGLLSGICGITEGFLQLPPLCHH